MTQFIHDGPGLVLHGRLSCFIVLWSKFLQKHFTLTSLQVRKNVCAELMHLLDIPLHRFPVRFGLLFRLNEFPLSLYLFTEGTKDKGYPKQLQDLLNVTMHRCHILLVFQYLIGLLHIVERLCYLFFHRCSGTTCLDAYFACTIGQPGYRYNT